MREESGLKWIHSTQTKLKQGFLKKILWIPKIAILLKHAAAV